VSETKFQVLAIFLKFYIWPPISIFMILMLHFMLDGLILKVIFVSKVVSRIVFKDGCLAVCEISGVIPT